MRFARRSSLLTTPQPLISIITTICATLVLVWSYLDSVSQRPWWSWQTIVAIFLAFFIIAAYHFPIHINTHTKVQMFTVPVFMLALLAPPALAGTATALAFFCGEASVRTKRGLLWSDIMTAASRWTIVVVVASSFTERLSLLNVAFPLVLLAGAAWLFVGDVLTVPLVLVAFNKRRPLHMIPDLLQGMWRVEAAQYLLGMVGVLLAVYSPWALLLIVAPLYLVYVSFKRAFELHGNTNELLERMADRIDQRDTLTEQHSQRVAALAAAICEELRIGSVETQLIVAAARVHDLGKIAIPDAILHKPGPLSDEEWAVMTTHVEIGAEILEGTLKSGHQGRRLAEIIRAHHARWDGNGYPDPIGGADIPIGGRVIAVADSFDAMISDRPYRPRMSEKQAFSILQQGRGTQWDAEVVGAFLRVRGTGVAQGEYTSKPVLAPKSSP